MDPFKLRGTNRFKKELQDTRRDLEDLKQQQQKTEEKGGNASSTREEKR